MLDKIKVYLIANWHSFGGGIAIGAVGMWALVKIGVL